MQQIWDSHLFEQGVAEPEPKRWVSKVFCSPSSNAKAPSRGFCFWYGRCVRQPEPARPMNGRADPVSAQPATGPTGQRAETDRAGSR